MVALGVLGFFFFFFFFLLNYCQGFLYEFLNYSIEDIQKHSALFADMWKG